MYRFIHDREDDRILSGAIETKIYKAGRLIAGEINRETMVNYITCVGELS